mmetsp:Transcript_131293/g.365957  ORF Transcript_131293/g.365957 Transcript_131293/m.365957 type:complete len:411 (-) Transcript_131293:219-1451(-)
MTSTEPSPSSSLRVDAPEFVPQAAQQAIPLMVPPVLPYPGGLPGYVPGAGGADMVSALGSDVVSALGLSGEATPDMMKDLWIPPAVAPGGPQVLLTVPPDESALRNHYGITAGTGRAASSSTQVVPDTLKVLWTPSTTATDSPLLHPVAPPRGFPPLPSALGDDQQQEGLATAPLAESAGFEAVRAQLLKYRGCLGSTRKPRSVRLRAVLPDGAGGYEAAEDSAVAASAVPLTPGGAVAGAMLLDIVQGKATGGQPVQQEGAALLQLLQGGNDAAASSARAPTAAGPGIEKGGGRARGQGRGRKGWGEGGAGSWLQPPAQGPWKEWESDGHAWWKHDGAQWKDGWKWEHGVADGVAEQGRGGKAPEKPKDSSKLGVSVPQSRVDIRKAAAAARQTMSNQGGTQKGGKGGR